MFCYIFSFMHTPLTLQQFQTHTSVVNNFLLLSDACSRLFLMPFKLRPSHPSPFVIIGAIHTWNAGWLRDVDTDKCKSSTHHKSVLRSCGYCVMMGVYFVIFQCCGKCKLGFFNMCGFGSC